MTTTTKVTPLVGGPHGAQPARHEIAAVRQELARWDWPSRFVQTLGRLQGFLELITFDHRNCQDRHCGLCMQLRQAHANTTALHELLDEERTRT
jgi:hypothetical protein